MAVFAQMKTTTLFLLFFILSPSLSEDTVKEDLGSHQLQRLVDLLTVHECEELITTLSNPEENIFHQLTRLSEEMNQLKLPSRTPRDADKESLCHPVLIDWLQTQGEQMYYDRLSRALQQIGRTDIAIEMGKNINQDKTLAMQRYVEEYHEQVNKIASQRVHVQAEETSHQKTHSTKQVRSLTWKDLDLVVELRPMPPYRRHMLESAWPLLYGFILGVVGPLLFSIPLLVFCLTTTTNTR